VTLRGTGPNADAGRRIWHGSTRGNERGEYIDLARRQRYRRFAAEPVPHASRLAAASHSSRPSIGMS
jgi:hypothetical protein